MAVSIMNPYRAYILLIDLVFLARLSPIAYNIKLFVNGYNIKIDNMVKVRLLQTENMG